ncbi:hypothetical protein BO94DRAFT_77911 [Aspergillus sclerotioniger CBS 115572]|uniref:WW domain-containing protein n=1 Tax=Aspergillus sclerotioniger CBS 115572 TaxID=1450535 RepID=A0A317WLY5_9EURO|nr:hypothetical protein BO94DRAFT_77911 [Aspergillus sclerotioniger CBS 115572]PWY86332.1 hypothetical protein BO94DRAFT_77911 [Aspergillus sclerotioniger CBS 115572]
MSFVPPPGPPTPSVPEGWKAQFDDRYKQWFYVNLRTGKSQWECPEGLAHADNDVQGSHSGPPPSYEASGSADRLALAADGDRKRLNSGNPYHPSESRDSTLEGDARLAAQLQAEEDARARPISPAQSGAVSNYYTEGPRVQSAGYQSPQVTPPGSNQQRNRGFFSKLMGRSSGSSSAGYGRPQQSYRYPQGGYSGGYPPQQAGYGYPSYPAQGNYHAPQQPQQQQRRNHGMGTAGAAALGVGGGLLGGLLLADVAEDFSHDFDSPPPPDFGGGDFGDGDFGGGDDFGGGGDFGDF